KIRGRCHTCEVPESLENIALECDVHGQKLIWSLIQQLWSQKCDDWPTLTSGLILGCNLVGFKPDKCATP
ncbi:hypothetical protein C8J57DRAFT_1045401, partial [Mycena rebaudengoi]